MSECSVGAGSVDDGSFSLSGSWTAGLVVSKVAAGALDLKRNANTGHHEGPTFY